MPRNALSSSVSGEGSELVTRSAYARLPEFEGRRSSLGPARTMAAICLDLSNRHDRDRGGVSVRFASSAPRLTTRRRRTQRPELWKRGCVFPRARVQAAGAGRLPVGRAGLHARRCARCGDPIPRPVKMPADARQLQQWDLRLGIGIPPGVHAPNTCGPGVACGFRATTDAWASFRIAP
jgi:hypothetical protein